MLITELVISLERTIFTYRFLMLYMHISVSENQVEIVGLTIFESNTLKFTSYWIRVGYEIMTLPKLVH